MSLYHHPKYVPVKATPLDAKTAIWVLKEAWIRLFGEHISIEALCVLAAQSALETGRWQKINNYNFGNVKMVNGKSFTMFATGENLWNNKLNKSEYKWFEPPHIQTAFRVYDNPIDGAVDYLSFISDRKSSEDWRNQAYKKAFEFLRQGKPKEFSYALHDAGYYTANPDVYTAGVVRLFDEFLRRKEELMSWIPEEHDTDPAPPPVSNPEHDTDLDIQPPTPVEEHDTEVDNPIPEPDVEPTKPITIEPSLRDFPVKPVYGNEFVTLVALVITGLSALFAWLLGGGLSALLLLLAACATGDPDLSDSTYQIRQAPYYRLDGTAVAVGRREIATAAHVTRAQTIELLSREVYRRNRGDLITAHLSRCELAQYEGEEDGICYYETSVDLPRWLPVARCEPRYLVGSSIPVQFATISGEPRYSSDIWAEFTTDFVWPYPDIGGFSGSALTNGASLCAIVLYGKIIDGGESTYFLAMRPGVP